MRWLSASYVNCFRSIPLVMVLLWFYLIVPHFLSSFFNLSPQTDVRLVSAIVAFTAFEAAYYAEIIRAGMVLLAAVGQRSAKSRATASLAASKPPSSYTAASIASNASLSTPSRVRPPWLSSPRPSLSMAAPGGGVAADPTRIADQFDNLLAQAASVAPTLAISPPPVTETRANARIALLVDLQRRICQRRGIPFAQVYTLLANNPDYTNDLSDGLHPGSQGCALMAQILLAQQCVSAFMRTA